jgi:transcriptional regulator with XRE-family HTH domain
MTQKELGLRLGFLPVSADVRIAQYESGSRRPKAELLASMASVLGISLAALTVPDIDSSTGLMQTLFALEDEYGITIEENATGTDFRLNIPYLGFTPLALDLSFWSGQRRRLDSGEITQEEYDEWRYRYE